MFAPSERKFSENESDDGQDENSHQMVPASMDAATRQQFLREMVKNLPQKVQNRITVLKNIQMEQLQLEAAFHAEVEKLERAYHAKYQPLYNKRKDIVTGQLEPTKEEPKWKIHEESDDEAEDATEKKDFSARMWEYKQMPDNIKGIPHFWLTIFNNVEILSQMVEEHDEPILESLTDIKIKYDDEHSFTLEFHFEKNDYFSNAVLTKQYFLKAKPDVDYPFDYDGPTIEKCKGCHIDWQQNRNVTIKMAKKKQKKHGNVRTIVKQVRNESFFHFFSPPEAPAESNEADETDEETEEMLEVDYEIGDFLRFTIIPKAILYYTGDIVDDDDDDDEDDDEDNDEGDDDDEEDEESEHETTRRRRK